MCNCKNSGLGSSERPTLSKVETYTAPIFTPSPTTSITTSGMAQQVYVPQVKNTSIWSDISSAINSVVGFVQTNNMNKQLAASQNANLNNSQISYASQVPVQSQYAQQPPTQQPTIDATKIMKGVFLGGVILGGIYLIAKK